MMYQNTAGFAVRLHALAGRLVELKDRVREAVAVEVGRILGEAVRELITATFRGRLPDPTTAPLPRPGHVRNSGWGDDQDDWHRDAELDPYEPEPEPPARAPAVEITPRVGWAATLTGGVDVARSWAGRTGRWWVGAAVGLLTVTASVFSNPTVRATLSVFTAFAELAFGVLAAPS
jgi:hypothetical protein